MQISGLFHRTLLALGLAVFSLIFAPPSLAQGTEPPRGASVILTVEGRVEVLRVGSASWTQAQTNQVLRTSDRVRTGPKSRATIRLSNQSILRVNQLSTLEIQPPADASAQPTLFMGAGTSYLMSRDRPVETQFKTPQASGAVRGTEFNLTVAADGQTLVSMFEGIVELTNDFGAVTLASGEQGAVTATAGPRKSPVLNAVNIIQWALHYPVVADPDELLLTPGTDAAVKAALDAYRQGDLLGAADAYPADRVPDTDGERLLRAALYLGVGQVEEVERTLATLTAPHPLANAFRTQIAAVKGENPPPQPAATTASEWLAQSYLEQSQSRLPEALASAKKAAAKNPRFGAAAARVAELEFSFGRTTAALRAAEESLGLAPKNAQAHALKGFILASRNQVSAAAASFETAIALDPALGNAWLGRGLTRIRRGDAEEGRKDLQTAAALEPQRALHRSYLGKAFSNSKDLDRAERELKRAKELDPNDPTSWLYSALLQQQQNRINEGVRDLERSQELNDSRSLFRSRLLLDQDRAVRGVNLASIYKDAGMTDLSVREAARSVSYDYANSSAHLFLANSYEALLDPKKVNLRYETPYFSEFLMANLLAPVGAGSLSQFVSQQEYSKLMERDRFGVSSQTEYFSNGEWRQTGGHFGTFGNSSYALDVEYRHDPGQRPNNDVEETIYYAKIKQQLTPDDLVYFQVISQEFDAGDVVQYYDPRSASPTARVNDVIRPTAFAGYHHQWSPNSRTIALVGLFDAELQVTDSTARILTLERNPAGTLTRVLNGVPYDLNYRRELQGFTAEAQHIWQTESHGLVAGAKYQEADADVLTTVRRTPDTTTQNTSGEMQRAGAYAYYHWQVIEPLRLTAGLSYDRLEFPQNMDTSPVTTNPVTREQVSPKAGFILTPWKDGFFRGSYTRSLGGLFFDSSLRLEPTQIAGFNQAFRSLIPESSGGLIAGAEFETFGVGFDQSFKSGTYVGLDAELLRSDADRWVGAFSYQVPPFNPPNFGVRIPPTALNTQEILDFEERSLLLTVNQLLGDSWSIGARYRISEADLQGSFPSLPATVAGASVLQQDKQAVLHQLTGNVGYTHRCGFFANALAAFYDQSNHGYTPDLPGDQFWQFHAYAGYRFHRRMAEIRLGLLNIGDQDYQLNPLNLYSELPRERTFTASFKFNF